MEKLTILIAITLTLISPLSADDESIVLDHDILYWKPAGPDIELPDVFYHPVLPPYDAAVFDDNFISSIPPKAASQNSISALKGPGDSEPVVLRWEPPELNLQSPGFDGSIDLFGSFPYGIGVALRGEDALFSYETAASFMPWNEYPQWARGAVRFDNTNQFVSGSTGWRHDERHQIISFFQWKGETGGQGWNFGSGFQFRNIIVPDETGNAAWAATGSLTADGDRLPLHLTGSLEGEYFSRSGTGRWRVSPEISAMNVLPLSSGDITYSFGGRTDIYTYDFKIRYFPEGKIMFRNHGSFSVFLESKGQGLDKDERFKFLVEEPGFEPDVSYFYWQKSQAGFHFTLPRFQGYTAAGLNRGPMPLISTGRLISEDRTLLFSEINLNWQLIRRIIMEINSYADYQDGGKYRFLGNFRMAFGDSNKFPSYVLALHTGNRELLRGYQNFYYAESDILYGIGFDLEISKFLKVNSSLDYSVSSAHLEGGATFSYSF